MSRASHTPAQFWLQMPLKRFFRWIESVNEVEEEESKERDRTSGKQ